MITTNQEIYYKICARAGMTLFFTYTRILLFIINAIYLQEINQHLSIMPLWQCNFKALYGCRQNLLGLITNRLIAWIQT